MKIAITIWGNRVSPVFDAARTLMIAEIAKGRIIEKTYTRFSPASPIELIQTLDRKQIQVLVCGAISSGQTKALSDAGIHLISFVTGNAVSVLDHVAAGQTLEAEFIMPGAMPVHTDTACNI